MVRVLLAGFAQDALEERIEGQKVDPGPLGTCNVLARTHRARFPRTCSLETCVLARLTVLARSASGGARARATPASTLEQAPISFRRDTWSPNSKVLFPCVLAQRIRSEGNAFLLKRRCRRARAGCTTALLSEEAERASTLACARPRSCRPQPG